MASKDNGSRPTIWEEVEIQTRERMESWVALGESIEPDEIARFAVTRAGLRLSEENRELTDKEKDRAESIGREVWRRAYEEPVADQVNGSRKRYEPLQYISAADLVKKEFPPVQWIVPDYIPSGGLLLGGAAKSGKTTMALNIAIAAATGGKCFMAIDMPEPTDVLFLSLETSERLLKSYIETMAPDGIVPRRLHLLFQDEFKERGAEAIERLRYELIEVRKGSVGLVVVDTMKAIGATGSSGGTKGGKGGNAYEKDYDAVKPYNNLATEARCGIMLLHHTNKGEWTDPFDSLSGSMGYRAAVDTESVMLPTVLPDGSRGATLHIRGREVESAERAFQLDPEFRTWKMLGSASGVMNTEERQAIYDIVKAAGDKGISAAEVARLLAGSGKVLEASTVRRTMGRMRNQGKLVGGGHTPWRVPLIDRLM